MAIPLDDDTRSALEKRALANTRALVDGLVAEEADRKRKQRIAIVVIGASVALVSVLWGLAAPAYRERKVSSCERDLQFDAAEEARKANLAQDPSISREELARRTSQAYRDAQPIARLECSGAHARR
jgi:hypothetical protein